MKYHMIIVSLISFQMFCDCETSSMNYEQLILKNKDVEQTNEGLYNESDSVTILTSDNFNQTVYDRPIATFVEFYNSFCASCLKFAVIYKALAKEMEPWRPIADISAYDCANENNRPLCRNMEVMTYPTLRYFSPKTKGGSLGTNLDYLLQPTVGALIEQFTGNLVNETEGHEKWPSFVLYSGKNWAGLFADVTDPELKYIYVVSDELPGQLAQQAVLDFVGNDINVRIFNSANKDLMTSAFKLGVVSRDGSFEKLSYFNESRVAIATSIKEHMTSTTEHPDIDEEKQDNLTITRQMFVDSLGDSQLHIRILRILAYIFIIVCMMFAAVKFYFLRLHRKKLYASKESITFIFI